MKKLIVREESVRNVFYELLPQYNEFILNPPSLYRDGNDRIIDDISSMLNYLMNFSSEEQAESVLRRFTDEAGLNGNVKDIFIGFRNSPKRKFAGGKYSAGIAFAGVS